MTNRNELFKLAFFICESHWKLKEPFLCTFYKVNHQKNGEKKPFYRLYFVSYYHLVYHLIAYIYKNYIL